MRALGFVTIEDFSASVTYLEGMEYTCLGKIKRTFGSKQANLVKQDLN